MTELIGSTLIYSGGFLSMMMVAIFLENTILTRAIGTSTVLLMLRKKANLVLFGAVLTFVTVAATVITFFVNPLIAKADHQYYITPLIYVLIISAVYIVAVLAVSALPQRYSAQLKPMVHLSAFNFTVLGSLYLSSSIGNLTLLSAIGFGLGSGIGFMLAMFLISINFEYLNSEHIPRAFRGFPITMLYIGILSMAFYGLVGHQLPV